MDVCVYLVQEKLINLLTVSHRLSQLISCCFYVCMFFFSNCESKCNVASLSTNYARRRLTSLIEQHCYHYWCLLHNMLDQQCQFHLTREQAETDVSC